MITTKTQAKYVEWLSADVMHQVSKQWLSELNFIKDEQLFFDDLIKSYTLQLIDSKHFQESKKIVDRLSQLQKKTDLLIEVVKTHKNGLQIMLDGIDQPKKEDTYKKEHRALVKEENDFTQNYRTLKTDVFNLVKEVLKEGKQKRLLQ